MVTSRLRGVSISPYKKMKMLLRSRDWLNFRPHISEHDCDVTIWCDLDIISTKSDGFVKVVIFKSRCDVINTHLRTRISVVLASRDYLHWYDVARQPRYRGGGGGRIMADMCSL